MASGAAAWSVKGIDEKTRNVAREAAAAAGLTIGEWIDQTIRLEASAIAGGDSEGGADDAVARLEDMAGAVSTDAVPTDPTSVELLDFLDTELERSRKRIDRSLVPIGRVLHDLAVRIVETEGRRPPGTIERMRPEPAAEPDQGPGTVIPEPRSARQEVGDRTSDALATESSRESPADSPGHAPAKAGLDTDDGWDDPIWSDPAAAGGSGSAGSGAPEGVVTASAELDVAFADGPEPAREELEPVREKTDSGGAVTSESEPSAPPPSPPLSPPSLPEPIAAMPRSRAMADYVADAPDPRADLSERLAVTDFEEPDPTDFPDLAPEPDGDFSPAITPLDMGGDLPSEDLDDDRRAIAHQADGAQRQPDPERGSGNGTWQARVDDWDAAPDPSGDFDRRVRLDEAMDSADAVRSRVARGDAGEASSAGQSGPSSESSSLEDRLDALRRAAARDDSGPVDDDPRDDDLPVPPTYATSSAPSLSMDESGPAIRFTGHQAGFESHPGRAVTERNQARRQRITTWSRRAATAMAAAIVLAVVGGWFAADRLGLQAEKAAVSGFLETKRAEVVATLKEARKSLSDGDLVLLAPGPETRVSTSEPNPLASVEIPRPTGRAPAAESEEPALVPPIPPTIPPSQQGVAPSGLASMDSDGSSALSSSAGTMVPATPSATVSGSGSASTTTPAKPSLETDPDEKSEPGRTAAGGAGLGPSTPASPTSGSSTSRGSNAAPPTDASRGPVATANSEATPSPLSPPPPSPPMASAMPSVDVARLSPPSGAGTADEVPANPGPGPLHLAWLQDQARRGDPRAQHDLAMLHYDGAGVTRDPIKAADWFREAAIQGDANAQYNLGVLYEKGLGVRQDDVRALLWYHSAAEQSHPVAQLNLGTLYAEGRGIPLSYEEARRWFQAAAENGVAAGYYNLGVLAETGLGGRPDEPAALDLYRLAAEMGHSGAAARLEREAADPDAVKPSDMQLAKTLGLERTERLDVPVVVEIQARLGRLGVYSGRIDGVAGPRTREAIRDYEAAKGLPVTGSPSDALLRHLREATDPIAGTPPVTG